MGGYGMFASKGKADIGEMRCYFRDTDGYIVEVGQSNLSVAYG
jgi:hypothetical protein